MSSTAILHPVNQLVAKVLEFPHLGSDNGYIDCGIGIPCPEQSAPGNYF